MGAVNLGNAPGLNSQPSACGCSACGWQEVVFGGIVRGPHVAQGQPPQTQLSLWPPGHPPWPSLLLVGLRRLFGTFFVPQGGYLRLRAKAVISDA